MSETLKDITRHPVYREARDAYADCGYANECYQQHLAKTGQCSDQDEWWRIQMRTESLRQLRWRAKQPVSRDEAIAIMQAACPAYNNFTPELLEMLPADCQVILARENSVCVYVNIAPDQIGRWLRHKLLCDNYGLARDGSGLLRIWWD